METLKLTYARQTGVNSYDRYTFVENEMPTLKRDEKVLQNVRLYVPTEEEADSILGQFPKYCKVEKYQNDNEFCLSFEFTQKIKGAITGDKNEQAIKRSNKMIEILQKMF